jgi:Uma2 family endonuclease
MSSPARALREPYREASYDPFEDDMGEDSLQRFISELLRPLIEAYLQEKQGPTFVGADQYIGWDPDDGEKVLSPDVYVLPGVEPGEDFTFWKVWQTGIVPTFALEIVSKRKKKDYTEVPPLYAELGVEELVIFDPRFKRRRQGLRFQVYRNVTGRGFVRVETTNGDRVRSQVLGAWIRAMGEGKAQRLRLAAGPSGESLFPTATEKAQAEKEKAQAEREHEKAERLKEKAAREQAEAEIARLRAELAGHAGGRPGRAR